MIHTDKKTYILLHGAWHAKWCWKHVLPLLGKNGDTIINLDLPGHGSDKTKAADIYLKTYVDFISKFVEKLATPVILVGHSLAGIIISQTAEQIPHMIDKLIYIAAFIPESGKSLTDEAKQSTGPGLTTEFTIDHDRYTIELKKSQRVKDLLYNHCSKEDVDFAIAALQKEPLRPMAEPIQVSAEKFGRVKKVFIECKDDLAVTVADQQRMYKKTNCTVISIDADHSPFFSAPEALAHAILQN